MNPTKLKDLPALLLASLLLLTGSHAQNASDTSLLRVHALDAPSLYQSLSAYFPIGAAVRPRDLEGEHGEVLKRHFNSIVAENDMKWARIHPAEDTFDF